MAYRSGNDRSPADKQPDQPARNLRSGAVSGAGAHHSRAVPRLARWNPARLGALVGILTLALDQAAKLYLLFVDPLSTRQPVVLAPFLELIMVWNRGISYGLFQQHSEIGRWMLVALSVLAAAGLLIWLRRATTPFLAASLGLIVGGAIGNAIDRVAYGAVFDFLHFHAGSFSWYVFNVADAAIVAGVLGLLYDSLALEKRRRPQAQV